MGHTCCKEAFITSQWKAIHLVVTGRWDAFPPAFVTPSWEMLLLRSMALHPDFLVFWMVSETWKFIIWQTEWKCLKAEKYFVSYANDTILFSIYHLFPTNFKSVCAWLKKWWSKSMPPPPSVHRITFHPKINSMFSCFPSSHIILDSFAQRTLHMDEDDRYKQWHTWTCRCDIGNR